MCTHILVSMLLRSNTYFDAIIALKIGNRLAIIKIVKKSSMGLCCLIFSYIYIYIYILEGEGRYNKYFNLLQYCSSLKSPQSSYPSHNWYLSIHIPLLHWNCQRWHEAAAVVISLSAIIKTIQKISWNKKYSLILNGSGFDHLPWFNFLSDLLRQCSVCGSLLSFVLRVCLCLTVVSVPCSLVDACWKGQIFCSLVCDVYFVLLSLPIWYPGSGMELNCIDFWSLPSSLLW